MNYVLTAGFSDFSYSANGSPTLNNHTMVADGTAYDETGNPVNFAVARRHINYKLTMCCMSGGMMLEAVYIPQIDLTLKLTRASN